MMNVTTTEHKRFTLECAAEKLADFLSTQSLAENVPAYLKVVDALARVEKAKVEVQLLKEELRERRRESSARARKSVRRGGISPEAQAQIDELLGLKPRRET